MSVRICLPFILLFWHCELDCS